MYGPNCRRKIRCACYPCVKAKRGCDLERPCSRCVKKGIPEQCLEKKDYEVFFSFPSLLKMNAKHEEEDDDQLEQNSNISILKLSHAHALEVDDDSIPSKL
jgi:hypothetical protein